MGEVSKDTKKDPKLTTFRMKRKVLFVLAVVVSIATWCNASRSRALSTALGWQVRVPAAQRQSARGTKSFLEASDGISFFYPTTYDVENADAARLQKQWDLAYPPAHVVAYLTDKYNDAHVTIMVEDSPFDLESIRKTAPTGMDDWYWLKFTVFGNNKFYFYSGGNQSVHHPDQFFYDLNDKILSFAFDGPYPEKSPLPDFRKLGPIEQTVLTSLRTPIKKTSLIPPGGFLYSNEPYRFQLAPLAVRSISPIRRLE